LPLNSSFSGFIKFYHRRFRQTQLCIMKRLLEAQFDPNARIGPRLAGGLCRY
jgi:hypothetical protein